MTELHCLDAIDFSHPNASSSFKKNVDIFSDCILFHYYRNIPFNPYLWKPGICWKPGIKYRNYDVCHNSRSRYHNLPEYSKQELEAWLKEKFRCCLQYQKNIFCFTGFGCGIYYSIENKYWSLFRCKSRFVYSYYWLDKSLEKDDDFFISQAEIVAQREIPLLENSDCFFNYQSETTKAVEFLCGSKSELHRLTRLAAFALPELQNFFRESPGLIYYSSENDYYTGGVFPVVKFPDYLHLLSKKTKQVFDLIYKYNFFTGLQWEVENQVGLKCVHYDTGDCKLIPIETELRHYICNEPRQYVLPINISSPSSNHERIEAALERIEAPLELQEWLQGKLPEEEIKSYFEAG